MVILMLKSGDLGDFLAGVNSRNAPGSGYGQLLGVPTGPIGVLRGYWGNLGPRSVVQGPS